MKRSEILKQLLVNMSSKYIKDGGVWIGLHKFANYQIKMLEDDFSINLSGSYYGIAWFGDWEGIYYDENRDLFFYAGETQKRNHSNEIIAFQIKDDLLMLLTPTFKNLIKEAARNKNRFFVKYNERPTFLSLPADDFSS